MTPLVFVAEDEPELRRLLEEALEGEGYEVDTFPDGALLLAALASNPPDAVLLDINMPGPSGWDVRKRMEEDPETADIPVIAVTARGGSSVEASAKEGMGFTGFVRKPFRLHEVLEALDDALEAKA